MRVPSTELGQYGFSYLGEGVGDFAGEWEDWCDSPEGKERYGTDYKTGEPLTWVCKREFFLGGAIPFPPWTEGGQFARFEAVGMIPQSWEYDPVYLWRVQYQNPRRFAHLVFISAIIPGIAVPAAGIAGAAGPAYMAPFVFGPMAYQRVFDEAVDRYNRAKDAGTYPTSHTAAGITVQIPAGVIDNWSATDFGNWIVYQTMLAPVFEDMIKLIGRIVVFGPWTGCIIQALEKEGQNPHNPPGMRAMCLALTQNSSLFTMIINSPNSVLSAEGVGMIGQALHDVASVFEGAGAEISHTVSTVGAAIHTFAPAVGALFNGDPVGARDHIFLSCFGTTYSYWQQQGGKIEALVASRNDTNLQLLDALKFAIETVTGALKSLGSIVAGITQAFQDVLGPLDQVSNQAAATTAKVSQKIEEDQIAQINAQAEENWNRAVAEQQAAKAAGLIQSQPLVVSSDPPVKGGGLATLFAQIRGQPVPIAPIATSGIATTGPVQSELPEYVAPPQLPEPFQTYSVSPVDQGSSPAGQVAPSIPAAPQSLLPIALAGAGTGFLAGGPIGAGIGGALAVVISQMQKKVG